MTNEEAREIIKQFRDRQGNSSEDVEAFDMAIKALEQQPCEDCISLNKLDDTITKAIDESENQTECQTLRWVLDVMSELTSVTPQQKKGHWSRKTKVDAYDIAGVKSWGIKCQCDRCDFTTIVVEDFGYYNYCPNCGAKMEVEE